MNKIQKLGFTVLFSAICAFGHGDVTPQKLDTSKLPNIGEDWLEENPYSTDNKLAVEIGKQGYGENCARCHGLEVISGGIAPDLRALIPIDDDSYFQGKVLGGVVRNGNVYMPSFAEYLDQKGIWAIKTYINTQRAKALEKGDL